MTAGPPEVPPPMLVDLEIIGPPTPPVPAMSCGTCGRRVRPGETVIQAGAWLFCRGCVKERLVVESGGGVRLY